jgi:hypothetical protein
MTKSSSFATLLVVTGIWMSLACVNVGCAPTPKKEETTTTIVRQTIYTAPPRDDTEAMQRFVTRLQSAQDASQEYHALQDIHDFQTDHNLTYRVQTVRLDTNTIVKSGSTQPYRLRVDVSVFKGNQSVYDFSFVPLDNRNLTLLGE